MKLETIFETYGRVDYYDMHTGLTYALSKLCGTNKYDHTVTIPVFQNGTLYGYSKMENPYYVEPDVESSTPEFISKCLGKIFSDISQEDKYNLIGIKNKDVLEMNVGEYYIHLFRRASNINLLYVSGNDMMYKFVVTDTDWQACWNFLKK